MLLNIDFVMGNSLESPAPSSAAYVSDIGIGRVCGINASEAFKLIFYTWCTIREETHNPIPSPLLSISRVMLTTHSLR